MPETYPKHSALGVVAVRAACLWILAGALFKLTKGSPNDLPPTVVELANSLLGLGPGLTFKLAIAAEISIAVPALLRPRLVWPLVAALLLVFCGVLVPMVLAGEASCGCFGSKVTIPPWVMLSIDGTLLLAILVLRPWRAAPARRSLLVPIGLALVLAWVAPFALIPSGVKIPAAGGAGGSGGTAGASTSGSALPRFVDLDPQGWVGKSIRETELAALMDVDAYAQDATWILYRVGCGHCADHLRELGNSFAADPKIYVFVRLSEPNEEDGRLVDADLMPPGDEVLLPAEVDYVVTAPWTLELEGGVIVSAVTPEP